ncbi:condensation domain-containing protein [Streptomyces sp. JW3]|uniref:condensation domain-containing protein n=1 Tax=Streptomyces sp. JW3 TaxID=3456955 RepID=UPI003FA42C86
MLFIDLRDLHIRPGRLTVWRPSATSRDGLDWLPDRRRASYAQQTHLAEVGRGSAGRRPAAWLAAAFDLPASLDRSALQRALLEWIDHHETLRSRLIPDEGGKTAAHARVTLKPGSVALQGTTCGDFTDTATLLHHLEIIFDRETDPLIWPSYVFTTVERRTSTTLLLGFDHHHVDGYSIFQISQEVQHLYQAALAGYGGALAPVAGYPDFAETERVRAALLHTCHQTIVRWQDAVSEAGGQLPSFFLPVHDPGPRRPDRQASGVKWLLNAEQSLAFDAACRRQNGGVFAGVLACFALAARQRSGNRIFRAVVPFRTGDGSAHLNSMGWYVGVAPLSVPVDATAGFGQMTTRSVHSLREARALASVPLARVSELLGQSLEVTFMISYMDLRGIPGAGQWRDWKASALRSGRVHDREVYLWIMRNQEGLYLSYRHPDSFTARAAVPSYLMAARHLMRQVATSDVSHAYGYEGLNTAQQDSRSEETPCG